MVECLKTFGAIETEQDLRDYQGSARPEHTLILSAIPPLNHCYKTLLLGTQFLRDMSPLCPLLPGKAIKLFFFTSTKTLVSKIQFGTSAQRPNF